MSRGFLSSCSLVSVLLVACGGGVTVQDPESSSGQTGAGGGAATTSAGASAGSAATGTATSTSGAGGAVGTECGSIVGQADCIAAFPGCVPVYDDECCPSCEPTGVCADCVDFTFNRCAPAELWCAGTGRPGCGFVPAWACSGGQATCSDASGSSPTPCHGVAGCELTQPSQRLDCDPPCQPKCTPVTGGSCDTLCNSAPPKCDPGTVAQSDGSCWTGWCIPAEVCADP
jgi:hypothetical protein